MSGKANKREARDAPDPHKVTGYIMPWGPSRILKDAVRAVPAVRYALGIAGIVSAIALVAAMGIDLRVAAWGTIVILVLMVGLVVFAKITTTARHHFVMPALILMWSFLALLIASAVLIFLSVFFKSPVDLQNWISPTKAQETTNRKPDTAEPPPTRDTRGASADFARLVHEFGTEGFGRGQFKDARTIALDGSGHLYVGEYSNRRVQVFDLAGKYLAEWTAGAEDEWLGSLTADRHGTVYAVIQGRICRFDGVTGKPLGQIEGEDFGDIFAAQNGDIYAAQGHAQIVIFGRDGTVKKSIDVASKVGEEVRCGRIAVTGTGEIYAVESRRHVIIKLASDGRYINRFGGRDESDPYRIDDFCYLAVDGQHRVYVSGDVNFREVRVFDGEGAYLGSFGGGNVVSGMAIGDQDEIYALFRTVCSVRKYVAAGKRG